MQTGYFADTAYKEQLIGELKDITGVYDRLIIAKGPPQKTYWAQNIWLAPLIIPFSSISDAAHKLKMRQKLWTFYPYQYVRRGNLILEKLAYFSPKPYDFPAILKKSPLGAYLLLDENTLLAASETTSFFPHGEVHFNESKIPPSRAYLKLWEVFTRLEKLPQKGEKCLEVGASPGSWTFVLQSLGLDVVAVDKAPLEKEIASLSNVTFLKKDAFSIKPADYPDLDWIFSDVVCYPEKLLKWIKEWLIFNPHLQFVCTLKFQGEANYQVIEEFAKIPGSEIVHLYHNKHELTWYKVEQG